MRSDAAETMLDDAASQGSDLRSVIMVEDRMPSQCHAMLDIQQMQQRYMEDYQKYDDDFTGDRARMENLAGVISAEKLRDIKAKEETFRKQGNDDAANTLLETTSATEDSIPNLVKVHDDIHAIARLLLEISWNLSVGNPLANKELIEKTVALVDRINTITGDNLKAFEQLHQRFLSKTAEQNQNRWKMQRDGASNCFGGISLFSASFCCGKVMNISMSEHAGQAIARMPVLGKMLTSKSTTPGWLGASASHVSLMPGTPVILGTAACCLCGAGCAATCLGQQSIASVLESNLVLDAMIDCRNTAQMNRDLWKGIHLSSATLKNLLSELPQTEEKLAKPSIFWAQRMHKFGQETLMQGQAVDVFLLSLEICGHVPKNYNIAELMGKKRYDKFIQYMKEGKTRTDSQWTQWKQYLFGRLP